VLLLPSTLQTGGSSRWGQMIVLQLWDEVKRLAPYSPIGRHVLAHH
jgi:hypothetical protein